jgi:hypothetical protein
MEQEMMQGKFGRCKDIDIAFSTLKSILSPVGHQENIINFKR